MIRRLATYCLLFIAAALACAANSPKQEFRGAWIQTIYQGYDKRTTAQNKAYLTNLLDQLQEAGINAVIFQVRPRADAFYAESLEPWSASLTGTIGKAPSPFWDPLAFMIEESHRRGMELHAWLNPYCGPTVAEAANLPANHLLKKYPKRFIAYNKKYYFDPSQQVNRDFICAVVSDILARYDVDGIHFDDYFYPYPAGKLKFNDDAAYNAAKTKLSQGDWRRENVDKLIEQVSATISATKPWVRFGVSPFGIWRNAASDSRGSKTAGLQNYDDLYADVLLWAQKGWVDYLIPQLYWEMNHKVAAYSELAPWWIATTSGCHIYIGQDAEKTAKFDELDAKMELAENADGNCWWYAASLGCIADKLKAHHYAHKALVPEYIWKQADPANKPEELAYSNGSLTWQADSTARKWVVYRFDSDNNIDINNPSAICAVTYNASFRPTKSGIYIVTALDHTNGESAPSKHLKIKL